MNLKEFRAYNKKEGTLIYEDDWEEDAVARTGIEIMPFTNLWDHGQSRKKMYSNDLISFTRKGHSPLTQFCGRIILSEESGEWIVVDEKGQFIEKLAQVECPQVIGNWFADAHLLS
ncbi:MAG: hypothetical protein AB7E31_15870 [Desulfitobacterium sp.]